MNLYDENAECGINQGCQESKMNERDFNEACRALYKKDVIPYPECWGGSGHSVAVEACINERGLRGWLKTQGWVGHCDCDEDDKAMLLAAVRIVLTATA